MSKFIVEKDLVQEVGFDKILWMGKYKGKTIKEAIDEDAGYINWCLGAGIFELEEDIKTYFCEKHTEFMEEEAEKKALRDEWEGECSEGFGEDRY